MYFLKLDLFPLNFDLLFLTNLFSPIIYIFIITNFSFHHNIPKMNKFDFFASKIIFIQLFLKNDNFQTTTNLLILLITKYSPIIINILITIFNIFLLNFDLY